MSKADLLSVHRGWPKPVEALIEATEVSAMFGCDALDRTPVKPG